MNVPKRPGEPDCTWADISKIRRELGWEPRIPLEDGVASVLAEIDAWKDAPVWTPQTIEAANELVGALVMGLWNRLSRHQDRNAPFRLTRIETEATREGLAALAMLRRQELEGFVEGLFGKEEALDLPERAHRGLGMLSEMRALFEGAEAVARDETKPGTVRDMEKTLRLLRQMTRDAERELHAVLLSCARARRQMLASLPAQKPTLH